MGQKIPHSVSQDDSGVASAEQGLVILDGPNGVAISMTPAAAAATAESLLAAVEEAKRQQLGRPNSA